MERFAIKIDRKLKANLYKICRLCGMDYPDMVPILPEDGGESAKDDPAIDVEVEPEMSQKINVLIGLLVTKDDRMPQTMCTLCVDKVNDFYEFREMCYATYTQTRKLLGLKNIVKKPVVDAKPKLEVKEEPPVVPSIPNKFLNRKRKAEPEPPVLPKKETAPPAVSNKKLRLAAPPLKEAATKKAKLKGKDLKETKEEEKEVPVKEEGREVVTRKMKLMKAKDVKETKDDGKDVAVKDENKETNSKKDSKETASKKDSKEIASKKDSKEKCSKKDSKETASKKDIKETAPKKDSKENVPKKDSKEIAPKKDSKEISSKKDSKEIVSKKGKQKGKDVKDTKEDGKDVAVKDEIKEEIKEEPPPPPPPAPAPAAPAPSPSAKLKQGCTICTERFSTKGKLEAHVRLQHIPRIERYVCSACSETISKSFDIKNHQLWHKLSKTPYVCGLCGESIVSTYAYARHLHEHCFETPPALMVLDRECPQCHVSYATNFLYNTHPCAVKTKRCAGCNRLQRSEVEYVKHSALCAKVYLNYSKHIAPAVEAQEDAVRIKNENEVEAAAEEMARLTGLPLDMSPVVHLTRLSSPLIMAANQCVSIPGLDDSPTTTAKKSGKKGVSKKELKRVDELLKSTLDALVSIKHEPEVHVEPEAPPADGDASDNEPSELDQNMDHGFQEDYHHNEESDHDDREQPGVGVNENQEPVHIKQETDGVEATDNANKSSGGGLKLKIRKEHGQLNSSIIEQQSEKRAEKRKKKKKHKDKEKEKQQKAQKEHHEEPNSLDSFNTPHNDVNAVIEKSAAIQIKTEPLEVMDSEESSATSALRPQPEATIMTSIPMMQLQIACISEGVEFNGANAGAEIPVDEQANSVPNNHMSDVEDLKPNREELDRLLKITHVSSGVVEMEAAIQISNVTSGIEMETEETEAVTPMDHDGKEDNHDNRAEEDEQHVQENDLHDNQMDQNEEPSEKTPKLTKPKLKQKVVSKPPIKSRNKACKSTAKPSAPPPVLQISAIQSGVTLPSPAEPTQSDFIPMFIKPEPQNRGYSDEPPLASRSPSPSPSLSPSPSHSHSPSPSPPPSPTPTPSPSPSPTPPTEEIPQTQHFNAEEQAYISSIDFNNITVKQEKDLDINDIQISAKKTRSRGDSINGIKKRKVNASFADHKDADEDMEDDDAAVDDDMGEDEEESEVEEEQEEDEPEEEEEEDEEDEVDEDDEEEEREYRELEYPPELEDQQAEQIEETEEEDEIDENDEIENNEDSANTLEEAAENKPTNTQDANSIDNNTTETEEINNDDIGQDTPAESQRLPSQLPAFVISSVCSHAPDLMPRETENLHESEPPKEPTVGNTDMSEQVPAFNDKENAEQLTTLTNIVHEENVTKILAPPEPQDICNEENKDFSNTQELPQLLDPSQYTADTHQLLGSAAQLESLQETHQTQEYRNYSACEQETQQVPVLKIASVASGSLKFSQHHPLDTNLSINEANKYSEELRHNPQGDAAYVGVVDEHKIELTTPGENVETGIRVEQVVSQSQSELISKTIDGCHTHTTTGVNDEPHPSKTNIQDLRGVNVETNVRQGQVTAAFVDPYQSGITTEEYVAQGPTNPAIAGGCQSGIALGAVIVLQGQNPLSIESVIDGSHTGSITECRATTTIMETPVAPCQGGMTTGAATFIVQGESTNSEMVVDPCQRGIIDEATNVQVQGGTGAGAETIVDPCLSGTIPNEMTTGTIVDPCQSITSTQENMIHQHQSANVTGVTTDQRQYEAATEMDVDQSPIGPTDQQASGGGSSIQQNQGEIIAGNNAVNQQLTETSLYLCQSETAAKESMDQSTSVTIEGVVKQTADMQLQAQPIIESQENVGNSCANQTGNEDEEEYDDEDEYGDGEAEDEEAEAEEEEEEEEVQSEEHSNLNLEEQQNQQNLEQQFSTQLTRPTALALHPYLEDISSSSNSFLSNTLSQTPPPAQSSTGLESSASTSASTSRNSNNSSQQPQRRPQNYEETENILNESNDMLSRRRPSSSNPVPFNFDNINEIAENNNNANIEREQLQDDQQQQQQQRHHQQTSDDVT